MTLNNVRHNTLQKKSGGSQISNPKVRLYQKRGLMSADNRSEQLRERMKTMNIFLK